MRQASGEANITIIVIMLIGILIVAGALLIPRILNKTNFQACCEYDDGIYYNNQCYKSNSCTRDEFSNKIISCTTVLNPKCKD